SQDELIRHFRAIAGATELPLLVYSNPGRTGVPLRPATVRALADVDGIVGLKDSSGDLGLTADYIRQTPDGFAVLVGRDTLIYPALCVGAAGAIASTANIAPALAAQIYQAHRAGRHERALELQNQLAPLRALVDRATFPVVLKEGLRLVGVEAGWCLEPARDLAAADRAQLAQVIAGLPRLEAAAQH
ncbi:MAG: dihydrodipicolinate synthase family protein, partial [Bifidobacteriaceae bacterium]|nr:dihydrodipicolinate synthase family protein [Bifidobacteriaceae bacterium]